MINLFKEQSIRDVMRYNRQLMVICIICALSTLLCLIYAFSREERWILIPAIDTDRRMSMTSKIFHESYLKEWATTVMRELFYTCPELVDEQIALVKTFSAKTLELDKFFKAHKEFIEGSRVSCSFFPKEIKTVGQMVAIKGTFHYWFGSSDKYIADEKTYLLSYKRAHKGILLLTSIEEQKNEKPSN